jgi:hypothetical protein
MLSGSADFNNATNISTVYFQFTPASCDPRQYCCNTLQSDLYKLQLEIGKASKNVMHAV